MATFKALVLPHQKRKDNTYNIKIRVHHQNMTRYIPTPWYAKEKDLGKNREIKSYRLMSLSNGLIDELVEKYEGLGASANQMSADDIVNFLTKREAKEEEKPFELNFVQYTREYIEKLKKSGHDGTAASYQSAVNSMVRYAGKEEIDVKELTTKFINGWMKWIVEQTTPKGKHAKKNLLLHSVAIEAMNNRAPSHYASSMRAMHNRAKKEFNDEDAGIIRISNSPFAKAEIPKPRASRKRALTVEQIRAIASLPIPQKSEGKRMELAKDVFLLSFFLVGMNAADLYNVIDFNGERLTYQRTKTKTRRDDKAEISIRVEPEIRPLLKKYTDRRKRRVFGFYNRYSTINTFNAALNKGLKQVGEALGIDNLEFYAARHSWATIAVNDAEIDKYTVHEALNHVDPSMRVTDIYIKKNWSNIDRANRKVIDLIFPPQG